MAGLTGDCTSSTAGRVAARGTSGQPASRGGVGQASISRPLCTEKDEGTIT